MSSSQRQIYVPPGGPPQHRPPVVFDAMGEEKIMAMIADFYRELETSSIRYLFPRDMVRAGAKSGTFFVGVLGGPPRYHERYGNPAMRARHMPFVIDETGRLEWMRCFDRVLARANVEYNFPAESIPVFRAFLDDFSRWMVNTAPGRGPTESERTEAALTLHDMSISTLPPKEDKDVT